MRLLLSSLFLLTLSSPPAWAQAVSGNPEGYFPAESWRAAPPGSVGMDDLAATSLSAAVWRGEFGPVDALVVIKDGYEVIASYRNWTPEASHTLQSVSKSVTSLLVGRAVADGLLDIDRPVLDYFPSYHPVAHLDDRKAALTTRHLLTMRTAMDFYELGPNVDSPLRQLNSSRGDWVRFVLDREMTGEPGSTWRYNSGAVILTSGLLREVTGERTDHYADRVLFGPLGIRSQRWFHSPFDSLPHTGGGLFLSPPDLARIGWLVLNHGRWGDRQVIPESWIAASSLPATRGAPLPRAAVGEGYGFWWWLYPSTRGGADVGAIIAGLGARGQWLFVMPERGLVVVIAGNGTTRGLDLLYEHILPAIH